MEAVAARGSSSFQQVGVHKILQKRLGFPEGAVIEGCGHTGSKVGAGDEAETTKHLGRRSIHVSITECKARPHLEVLDLELLEAGSLVNQAFDQPGEAPGRPS